MVFYFSGTGNSLWAAKQISEAFNEKLVSIADELNQGKDLMYLLHNEEKVFFVFPVHSWGPADLVMRFAERLKFENYLDQPVYMVTTCGDECGHTIDIFHTALLKRNISLNAGYSIVMPNNYILIQGFDVDNEDIEKQKLNAAPASIHEIIKTIQENTSNIIYQKGKFAWLKSYLIYPLFRKFAIGKNRFYAKENCTSCNLCVKICPTRTITMKEGKPVWNDTCVQCTACIHRCPVKAIEYGKISLKKGRYQHPEIN